MKPTFASGGPDESAPCDAALVTWDGEEMMVLKMCSNSAQRLRVSDILTRIGLHEVEEDMSEEELGLDGWSVSRMGL
jgi:hypothetical protein